MNELIKDKIIKEIVFCNDMGAFAILFENERKELIININSIKHPNAQFFPKNRLPNFNKEKLKIRKFEYKDAYYEGCISSDKIIQHKAEFFVYFDKFGKYLQFHINDIFLSYKPYDIEFHYE